MALLLHRAVKNGRIEEQPQVSSCPRVETMVDVLVAAMDGAMRIMHRFEVFRDSELN